MRKWLILLAIMVGIEAEGMVPMQRTKVSLRTDVKVRSSKERNRRDLYSKYGNRTSVEKDTEEKSFLSIEVRNMTPRVVENMRIVYRLYALQFEHATNKTIVFSRTVGRSREKYVPSGTGELTIEQIKPMEQKVVESEPLETSYRSTQNTTKLLSETKTAGTKLGGWIVEYYVDGELVKVDASSRRLHEQYLVSQRGDQGSGRLEMRIGR